VVPEGHGKGEDLAGIVFSVLEEHDSVDTLEAVILDNTPSNTGQKGLLKSTVCFWELNIFYYYKCKPLFCTPQISKKNYLSAEYFNFTHYRY
jgi:hypothetical protein